MKASFWSSLRLGWRFSRSPADVELLGPCECGCGYSRIRFQGRVYHLTKRSYKMTAYALARILLS